MIGETVTRQRAATTTGRLNDAVLDWSNPDEITIDGVAIEPLTSIENHDNRDAVTSGFRLYLPPGADILPADRVVVRGDAYPVIGAVADWVNPFTGVPAGGVLTVERTAG